MSQLFKNKRLARVLPQFPSNQPLQNVYSQAEITSRVRKYLTGALGGRWIDDEIVVHGNYNKVYSQVVALKPMLKQFFESMPSLVKNMRKDTKLYTQYVNATAVENIRFKKHGTQKLELMQDVLDNIQYNDDFNSLNSIKHESPQEFEINKRAWQKKVGCK